MNPNQANTDRNRPDGCQYALRREANSWEVTFEGRQANFKHELGANYVAYLLLNPPKEPLHAVALALKARERAGQVAEPEEVCQERGMGLADAAAAQALWRRQRALERVLEDDRETEPVKAEALRELEEVTEFLCTSPWRSRHGAERSVQAVTAAIKRFHDRLVGAVDAEGKPDPVLRAFARHLYEYLLIPSGRGCGRAGSWAVSIPAGCFTYEPPKGVNWSAECGVRNAESDVQGSAFEVQGSLPRRVISRGSCAAGWFWRCWPPAAPAGPLRGARPPPCARPPALSSRPWCKARMLPRPPSRIRRASRCAPIPCPPVRESSNPRRLLPPQRNYQRSTLNLSTCSPQLSTLNRPAPSS